MADVLERVTNLLALLLESRPLSLQEIVDRLEGQYPPGEAARRAAFERDKALLRDIGVRIDTQVGVAHQAGQTLYTIDRAGYELSDLGLLPDERDALNLAVAAARNNDAQFGVLKMGVGGSAPQPYVVELPQHDSLADVHEAIANRRRMMFRYRGRDRQLDPYTLLLRHGHWYVIGFDLGHRELRTYRLDRVESPVGLMDDTFERPASFDVRAVFPDDPKLLGDEPEITAEVQVGSEVLHVPCANLDAFRAWLFELGDRAVVLGPPHVRRAVVDWLEAMAR